ncbi:hypothetical protein, partial [Pseudarthrobacter sp. NKDBFgelt]|uniref:hypothetical protein n=1 Tax=Pseudarthrobacter sp. NKDBFgelt TaxID=3384443 RepID=UPI0038D4A732
PVREVLDAYRFASEADMRAEVAELALAERYLSHRGTPGAFGEIAQEEALFKGLRRQLADLDPKLRSTWQVAVFAFMAGRTAIQAPVDRYFPFAEPVPEGLPEETLRRFAAEARIGGLAAEGSSLSPEVLSAIEEYLVDRRDEPATVPAHLFEIMDKIRTEHREGNAPHRAIKQLVKAKSALGEIEIGRMSPKQLRRLQSELAAIQAQVAALLGDHYSPANRQPPAGVLDRLLGRR